MLNFDRSTLKHGTHSLRIFKIIATSGFLTAWMHKIRFWPGLCPDPTEGAYIVPRSSSWFKGPYFWGGRRKGEKKVRGREREGPPLLLQIYRSALHNIGDIGYFEYDTVDFERRLYQSLEKYAEASKLDFSVCHNDVDERANHGQTFKNHTNLYID